jgi:GPH family glycoside/pentoside/hexuronide:cation symporter
MATAGPSTRVSLPGYAVFAAMLSAAGLPIYIHAPAYYATSYGVGLTALAGVLFAFGWSISCRIRFWVGCRRAERKAGDRGGHRRGAAGCRCWALSPWSRRSRRCCGSGSRWWASSPPSRSSRSRCMQRACRRRASWAHAGHLKLAGWRETGALLGVCAAAAAPSLLESTGAPYAGFAVGFAILCLVAVS